MIDLELLDRLEKEATPGEWDIEKRNPYIGYLVEGNKEKIQVWMPSDEYYKPGARTDAALIVALRNNAREMIDELWRNRAKIDELRAFLLAIKMTDDESESIK